VKSVTAAARHRRLRIAAAYGTVIRLKQLGGSPVAAKKTAVGAAASLIAAHRLPAKLAAYRRMRRRWLARHSETSVKLQAAAARRVAAAAISAIVFKS